MNDVARARLTRVAEDLRAVLVELDELSRRPIELGTTEALEAVETAKERAAAAMAWTSVAACGGERAHTPPDPMVRS